MNLIEAVKSGKPFKRPNWVDFARLDEYGRLRIGDVPLVLEPTDILAEDYFLEDWSYQIEEKFPNGVLCWVWDDDFTERRIRVVHKVWDGKYRYIVRGEESFTHAEPVRPEEAPAIIGAEIIKKKGE